MRNWRQSCELLKHLINETRAKLKESNEVARADRARLEAAEKRLSEFEMRAKTARAQARENANAVFRIEEAIRTQLFAKRLPSNKLAYQPKAIKVASVTAMRSR